MMVKQFSMHFGTITALLACLAVIHVSASQVNADDSTDKGACCIPSVGCDDGYTEATCETDNNGVFIGAETTCDDDNICGACCMPDEECEDGHTEATCETDNNGTFSGEGSACTAPQACCLPGGTCADLDPLCCAEQGGVSEGDGTTCATDGTCRACCLPGGGCENRSPEDCHVDNGRTHTVSCGKLGIKGGCSNVPATSEWGLAVLALVVLIAGTVVLRRRQTAGA